MLRFLEFSCIDVLALFGAAVSASASSTHAARTQHARSAHAAHNTADGHAEAELVQRGGRDCGVKPERAIQSTPPAASSIANQLEKRTVRPHSKHDHIMHDEEHFGRQERAPQR